MHHQAHLAAAIGLHAGIAAENARLSQQLAESQGRLAAADERLRSLTSCLTQMTSTDLHRSLTAMLDAAVKGAGAVAGSLTALDERDGLHRVETGWETVGAAEAVQKQNWWTRDARWVSGSEDQLQRSMERASHCMIRALAAEGRAIGLLKLVADPDGPGFSSDDRDFVQALVEHASVVVFNSMLYQEAEADRKALQVALLELQAKQNQLVQSEKLAAIGQLAAKVCHEINNPLTAIRGCTQLMQRKLRAPTGGSDTGRYLMTYLDTVLVETERCARITGDLLHFARQPAPRYEETDVHEVLNHAIQLVQYKYPSGLEVYRDFDATLPSVVADSQQLTQVLLNLLTNAAEAAMPSGGLLEVETRVPPGEDGSPGYVQVEIRDDGPGIDDEAALRAFDPFFTTKPDGTGLGLAISRDIMEQHGGWLDIAPRPTGGAVVTLRLPIAPCRFREEPPAAARGADFVRADR